MSLNTAPPPSYPPTAAAAPSSAPDPSITDTTTDTTTDTDTTLDAETLRTAIARSSRRLRRERSSEDITDGQYAVLAALDRLGAASPTALADHERVSPPSMTRTLTCLVSAGLVARTGDPDDGRRALVTLTDAGRHHIVDTRRARSGWLAARLDELDPAQRATLAEAAALLTALAER